MTRILSAFNLLKRVGFAVLLCAIQTSAQDWQTPIVLPAQVGSQIVVDSLHRLHAFGMLPIGRQPNSMYYCRYDNWGRLLQEPVELVPDTHWTEYAGFSALIDHLDRIHVVWYRQFSDEQSTVQLIYVRLSTEGEFLQEPYVYEVSGNQPGGIQADTYHLVETVTGEVWAACGGHYFAFDINGNMIEPVQRLYPHPESGYMKLAAAPDGSVWATYRKEDSNLDTLKTTRLWPPPRIEETTLISHSPGFGPQAFTIDRYGQFHYIIYTDEHGLYYRFDPRGSGIVIETVIDPSPYGVGLSNLMPIGLDSLQFMWGRTLPIPHGVNRVCFTLDGNVAFGPVLIPQDHFGIFNYTGMWRDGGYWIPGHVWGEETGPAMLHIPGPNEPLTVHDRHSQQTSQPSLHVYPQPNLGTLYFNLPSNLHGETNLTIYNILGQQVFQTGVQAPLTAEFTSVTLPSALASGTYLISLSTQSLLMTTRFVLIK
ncbi:MAG: T9SS type A sorting domain-containing protein [Calditrichaeota bacterium]|nr:T9SS type A sorting domain-containing protein [Calditrichota bacterium]